MLTRFKKYLLNHKKALIAVIGVLVLVATVTAITLQYSGVISSLPTDQFNLQGKVQAKDGSPTNGHDPASQTQNSLASVASSPNGNGQRTDNPAANAHGSHHQVNPSDVLADTNATGTLVNGCVAGYGVPGEQCLPGNKPIDCNYVRSIFKNGLTVTGSDSLNLDANNDKVACGSGDA